MDEVWRCTRSGCFRSSPVFTGNDVVISVFCFTEDQFFGLRLGKAETELEYAPRCGLHRASAVYYSCVTDNPIKYVFLDTQVYLQASMNFSGADFTAITKHFKTDRLNLVITDLTLKEVRKNLEALVKAEFQKQDGLRKSSRFLRSSSLDVVKAAMAPLDCGAIIEDLWAQFQAFLNAGYAINVDSSEVPAGPVLEKYFAAAPPFGNSKDKKAEFPDAITIEALDTWAREEDCHLYIVSGDDLLHEACDAYELLHPFKTVADVLDNVASDDAITADFVRAKIQLKIEEIAAQAIDEFEDYGFWVNNEDGEATVEVTEWKPEGSPEILELEPDRAAVRLNLKVEYKAHLSFTISATGTYDPETGALLYAEEEEEDVLSKRTLKVDVEALFEGRDPDSFHIDAVSLAEPARGFGITPSMHDPQHWK